MMKIFKLTLMTVLLGLAACNTEPNIDVDAAQKQNTTQQKTTYNLEEVLNGMRAWENIRGNETALLQLFNNANSLQLDMAVFPQGVPLHAYACLLDGELKFAVISEVYDRAEYHADLGTYIRVIDAVYTDIAPLADQTYDDYTFTLPTQYIQAADALNRIQEWDANYTGWLSNSLPVYQSFHIPTYSLAPQTYTAYFGLKNNEVNPAVKDADLVLDNHAGLYFDTIHGEPPYKDSDKYYILDLL